VTCLLPGVIHSNFDLPWQGSYTRGNLLILKRFWPQREWSGHRGTHSKLSFPQAAVPPSRQERELLPQRILLQQHLYLGRPIL